MARWALSPIVGTGTMADPYRAKAADYGAHVAIIPGNDDGTPRFPWALVRLDDSADMTAAAADTTLRLLPAWSLDHVLTAAEATSVTNALGKFGIAGYPSPTGRTVRQVLRWIADQLDITWQGVA